MNERTNAKKNYFILKWMCALCIERARTHSHTHTIERNTRKATTTTTTKKIKKNGVNNKRESPAKQSKNSIKLLYHKRIFPYIFCFYPPLHLPPISRFSLHSHTLLRARDSERTSEPTFVIICFSKQTNQTNTNKCHWIYSCNCCYCCCENL